jgi:hypothetical protein
MRSDGTIPRTLDRGRNRGGHPGNRLTRSTVSLLLLGLAATAAASLAGGAAAASPAEQEWGFATFGNDIGEAGLAVVDLDGDGAVEVVATSVSDQYPWEYYISVYESGPSGYRISRFSRPIDGMVTGHAVFDSDGDGTLEIYLGIELGSEVRIEIRDPMTFEVAATLTEPSSSIRKILLADADNDGSPEIIACSDTTQTWLYDAETRVFERSISYFGNDVEVGDVDGDPLFEMVFASGAVVQLVSGVATLEWTIPDAADGWLVELGNIDGDPQQEIFFVSGWPMKVYDFGVSTFLWQVDAEVTALVVTDVTGDPVPEVVWGQGQWGEVHCNDGVTGTEIWSIPNPQWGFTGLVVADTDNDTELEVLWSGFDNQVVVHDAATQAREWISGPSIDGPFDAVATGDADNDGDLEVLFASSMSANGYGDGIIFMFDALTHELEWRTEEDSFLTFAWNGLRDIAVGDVDDDGLNEVVVATDSLYDGAVHVFEGTTTTPAASYVYGDYGVMLALAIGDVDNDGATEIVTASDGMVHVIDGATGTMEWTGPDSIYDVERIAVGNLDGDPALEIVAAGEILRVFDGITHDSWSGPGSSYHGLDLVDFQSDGRLEIVTCSGTDLVVFQDAGGGAYSELDRFTVSAEPVGGVTAYRDLAGELVLGFAGSGTISALRVSDETIVWTAGPFGQHTGLTNNLKSVEIPTDSGVLVLVGSSYSVHQLGGPQAEIFSDGFESGNTGAWS